MRPGEHLSNLVENFRCGRGTRCTDAPQQCCRLLRQPLGVCRARRLGRRLRHASRRAYRRRLRRALLWHRRHRNTGLLPAARAPHAPFVFTRRQHWQVARRRGGIGQLGRGDRRCRRVCRLAARRPRALAQRHCGHRRGGRRCRRWRQHRGRRGGTLALHERVDDLALPRELLPLLAERAAQADVFALQRRLLRHQSRHPAPRCITTRQRCCVGATARELGTGGGGCCAQLCLAVGHALHHGGVPLPRLPLATTRQSAVRRLCRLPCSFPRVPVRRVVRCWPLRVRRRPCWRGAPESARRHRGTHLGHRRRPRTHPRRKLYQHVVQRRPLRARPATRAATRVAQRRRRQVDEAPRGARPRGRRLGLAGRVHLMYPKVQDIRSGSGL